MKPTEVNGENESIVWKTLFSYKQRQLKFIYEVIYGDQLQVSKQRLMFEKSYLPAWSEEIFTVSKRNGRQKIPVYKIKDYSGEEIQGIFYEQELQKVHKSDDLYRIEKVIRERKKGGTTEYLVKWLGYPSKFNGWVTDLKK